MAWNFQGVYIGNDQRIIVNSRDCGYYSIEVVDTSDATTWNGPFIIFVILSVEGVHSFKNLDGVEETRTDSVYPKGTTHSIPDDNNAISTTSV